MFDDGWVECSGKAYDRAGKDRPLQLTNVKSITCTSWDVAAMKFDGTVVTWESGRDNVSEECFNAESIASTGFAFAAKKRDGTVVTWGYTDCGGDPGSKQSKLIDIILIASARLAFAAMTRDGNIICWGQKKDFDLATAKCQRLK